MKLAILVALAPDKRSGRVISPELLPFDQAVKAFKQATTEGLAPSADLPVLELWPANPTKSQRFNPARARVASLGKSGRQPKGAAAKLAADLQAAEARIAELEAEIKAKASAPAGQPETGEVSTGNGSTPPAA